MKRRVLTAVSAALLSGLGQAANVRSGGKVVGTTLSQGGKVWISVDTLKAAGVDLTVQGSDYVIGAAGGQNQVAGVSGCLNEWLFNGVWRFRVTGVIPLATTQFGMPGWEVRAEFRNATNLSLTPRGTGFRHSNANVAFPDGNTIAFEDFGQNSSWDDSRTVIPAGALNMVGIFKADKLHEGQMPTKLIFLKDQKTGVEKLPFNTKDPAFRVDLTCKK